MPSTRLVAGRQERNGRISAMLGQKLLETASRTSSARLRDDSESIGCTVQDSVEMLISIIVPVYNEAASVLEVLGRLQSLKLDKEIILVDDGSVDGTGKLLEVLEHSPTLHVVSQAKNRGKGAAIRAGLLIARGEIVIIQDADLEYCPEDIPAVLAPLIEGQADAVYGSRFFECSQDKQRFSLPRLGNRCLTRLSNVLNGQRLTDMETGYKAIRRELMLSLDLKENRFGVEPELTAKLARKRVAIAEVPIKYCRRGYAEGKKIGPLDALWAIYCIVRYRIFK